MIEATLKADDLQKIFKKLDKVSPDKANNIMFRGMRSASLAVERQLKLNLSGKMLKTRTGRLRASIGSMVTKRGIEIMALIGSGVRNAKGRVKYANIQETGGIIRAKSGKFLAIPLPAALTPAGVPKKTSPLDYVNTFIAKGVIFQKKGKKFTPLYALKKSVRIPASKYLSKTLTETNRRVVGILLKTIDGGLKA